MELGIFVFGLFVGFLCTLVGWLGRADAKGFRCDDYVIRNWTIFASTATLALVCSIGGIGLYAVADEKVEYEMFLSVHTIGEAQYVQWNDPDTRMPHILNVNERFNKVFTPYDKIKVTVFSKGPYNGVYNRPDVYIELPNVDKPPAMPSDYYYVTPPDNMGCILSPETPEQGEDCKVQYEAPILLDENGDWLDGPC